MNDITIIIRGFPELFIIGLIVGIFNGLALYKTIRYLKIERRKTKKIYV